MCILNYLDDCWATYLKLNTCTGSFFYCKHLFDLFPAVIKVEII